ncbi:MAG: hypothetical protein ACFBSD_10225 [Paracoccaceae bacterium]
MRRLIADAVTTAILAFAGLACLIAALAPRAAGAGAWTQKEGAGQVIATVSRRASPTSGFISPEVDDDSNFVAVYGEYGLFEGFTVGGTAFVEFSTAEGTTNTANIGAFARKRLWQGQAGDVASVQVGIVQPIDGLLGDEFGGPTADPTQEISLRGQYGRGFGFDWGSAFVSTEAGYHLQTDGDDDEIRFDLTGGVQPWDCCMVILSTFTTWPIGDPDEQAVKIAPSVTYTFGRSLPEGERPEKPITLQLGLTQDVLNMDEGFGIQLGIWKAF